MTAGRTNSKQSSVDWCTPPKYVTPINIFFDNKIDLDPCSNRYSLINADKKISLPEDGLLVDWKYGKIFVNPPYGADRIRRTTIKTWISKCESAHREYNSEVLALIPVATNTRHWKDFIFGKAAGICFLYDTRLHFWINGKIDAKGAPMSCAIVYWGKNINKFLEVFKDYGAALDVTKSIGKKFCSSQSPGIEEGSLMNLL